ncbi:hypothetical protein [Treponema bryantii]|uniref:hypothetical protein n=1 Tax=Treponema bryantii TaxID=163 RepID=UPI0003B48146|nr:hypothetical protein [Treponema bryantii]
MIVEFSVYDTKDFSVEHLLDSDENLKLIKNFEAGNNAHGLCLAKYVGVSAIYIYALPEEKLMKHYKKMGFSRLPPEPEMFLQNHVKPKYDKDCIFMYQILG